MSSKGPSLNLTAADRAWLRAIITADEALEPDVRIILPRALEEQGVFERYPFIREQFIEVLLRSGDPRAIEFASLFRRARTFGTGPMASSQVPQFPSSPEPAAIGQAYEQLENLGASSVPRFRVLQIDVQLPALLDRELERVPVEEAMLSALLDLEHRRIILAAEHGVGHHEMRSKTQEVFGSGAPRFLPLTASKTHGEQRFRMALMREHPEIEGLAAEAWRPAVRSFADLMLPLEPMGMVTDDLMELEFAGRGASTTSLDRGWRALRNEALRLSSFHFLRADDQITERIFRCFPADVKSDLGRTRAALLDLGNRFMLIARHFSVRHEDLQETVRSLFGKDVPQFASVGIVNIPAGGGLFLHAYADCASHEEMQRFSRAIVQIFSPHVGDVTVHRDFVEFQLLRSALPPGQVAEIREHDSVCPGGLRRVSSIPAQMQLDITSAIDLHARPATLIIHRVSACGDGTTLTLRCDERQARATSITELMQLGLTAGKTVRVITTGPSSGALLEYVCDFFEGKGDAKPYAAESAARRNAVAPGRIEEGPAEETPAAADEAMAEEALASELLPGASALDPSAGAPAFSPFPLSPGPVKVGK